LGRKVLILENARLKIRLSDGLTGALPIALERPVRPNSHILKEELPDISSPFEHPEHFLECGLPEDLLGRKDRKTFGQIKTQRPSKQSPCADTGSVNALIPAIKKLPEEIKILLFWVGWVLHHAALV
jgi:hypothetical protein